MRLESDTSNEPDPRTYTPLIWVFHQTRGSAEFETSILNQKGRVWKKHHSYPDFLGNKHGMTRAHSLLF